MCHMSTQSQIKNSLPMLMPVVNIPRNAEELIDGSQSSVQRRFESAFIYRCQVNCSSIRHRLVTVDVSSERCLRKVVCNYCFIGYRSRCFDLF
jgi:hypothetical protein